MVKSYTDSRMARINTYSNVIMRYHCVQSTHRCVCVCMSNSRCSVYYSSYMTPCKKAMPYLEGYQFASLYLQVNKVSFGGWRGHWLIVIANRVSTGHTVWSSSCEMYLDKGCLCLL